MRELAAKAACLKRSCSVCTVYGRSMYSIPIYSAPICDFQSNDGHTQTTYVFESWYVYCATEAL